MQLGTDLPEKLIEDIKNIVVNEQWERLDDWFDEMADLRCQQYWEKEHQAQIKEIEELRPKVQQYQPHLSVPELPERPEEQLMGIGFWFDEDHDERLLIAIEQLSHWEGVVAATEHEGELTVFCLKPLGIGSMDVGYDTWSVTEYVPKHGQWSSINH